jgi:hypothetical protein
MPMKDDAAIASGVACNMPQVASRGFPCLHNVSWSAIDRRRCSYQLQMHVSRILVTDWNNESFMTDSVPS